jgi:hypothetical protein
MHHDPRWNPHSSWRNQVRAHDLEPWARLAPAATMVVLLAAVAIGTSTLFWALVPLALVGAISGRHPIDVLYSELIAPLIGSRPLARCGAPRRMSCLVAAAGLVACALAFHNGPTLFGGAIAGLMAAAMFVNATLDVCVPCFTFEKLFTPERVVPVRRITAEEPTMLLE